MGDQRTRNGGMLRWEHEHGEDVEAKIRALYTEQRLTQVEAARLMGISPFTLNRWMAYLHIPARRAVWVDDPSEALAV